MAGHHHITIGSNTVINPRARLMSNHSSIVIGEGCIISEKSVVGHSDASGQDQEQSTVQALQLKDGVLVDIGAKVEAQVVGEGTHVGVNARIGKGAIVGKV